MFKDQQGIEIKAPQEAEELARLLVGNAREAGLPEDTVYARRESGASSSADYLVGSNFEDGTPTFVLKDGRWFARSPWSGEDRPYTFAKACADARIMWTG